MCDKVAFLIRWLLNIGCCSKVEYKSVSEVTMLPNFLQSSHWVENSLFKKTIDTEIKYMSLTIKYSENIDVSQH